MFSPVSIPARRVAVVRRALQGRTALSEPTGLNRPMPLR